MPGRLAEIERNQSLAQADTPTTVVERICQIKLAANAPRAIELKWLRDRLSRQTLILLQPGQTVEQPRDKCRSWFGPFDLFEEYEEALSKGEEKVAAMLREHLATETARYLKRYDYPRGNGRGATPDMQPVGPHRSPDVSIRVMDPEGKHGEWIRLYKVYGIGEFDDLKDTFAPPETEAEIKARYESKLEAREREVIEMRRQLSELGGMVKGLVAVGAVAPIASKEGP